MQCMRIRLWVLRFAGASVLAAVIVLVWWLLVGQIPRWRLQREIHQFKVAPSQTLANKLMGHLTDATVTTEQGECILGLLLKPKITTRGSYPAGEPAGICVELPFSLESNAKMRLRRRIEDAPETPAPEHHRWTRVLTTEPQILMVPPPAQRSGTHRFAVSNDFRFTFTPARTSMWDRLRKIMGRFGLTSLAWRGQPSKAYHCRFTVPVEVSFVEESGAERIELISNTQIDETMRRTIVTAARTDVYDTYATPSGQRMCRGHATVGFLTIPTAVAWQVSLRLEDGQELPCDVGRRAQRIRTRSGSRGCHVIDMARFGIEEPGDYLGTLILRPDPNCAYEDPAIKSTWDGTLEFPISFVVYSSTQRKQNVQRSRIGP